MSRPTVFLIGAGPGDPGLLTVRGLDCLRRADVVVYDHEVTPQLLRSARPEAELIDVGGAGPTSMAEEAISYLLAEKAHEGKLVARLKWGDPFMFDRGGEEALFLQQQGVRLEVVPGIPIALAASEYAGIPLTYPGAGDTLTLVRGIDSTGMAMPDVDWQALAKLAGSILSYASAHQIPRFLDALLAHGCPPDTPAAIVRHGTLPTQVTETGTVAELLAACQDVSRREPGLLVVGRIVRFREHLRWFDARPLFGRRIVITRPRGQAGELIDRLGMLGAQTIEAPLIRILPADDQAALQHVAQNASDFDWIVFSSANAVDAFMRALFESELDIRALKGPRICAVGSATAEKLASYHIRVNVVPGEFRAEAAFDAIRQHGRLDTARVLLPRADIGREVLAEELRKAGADVTEVVAYRTVLDEGQREGDPDIYRMLLDGKIDAVTFTSASAVKNFVKVYGAEQSVDLLAHTAVASIGPVTSEAAQQLGIRVTIQPTTYTLPALADALAVHFAPAPHKVT